MDGFIKLHRKIMNWEWYTDPPTALVFLTLLLKASYRDAAWRGTPVRRGQVITSRAALANACGLTESQVRTALKHLVSTGEVTCRVTSCYTLITIVKYGFYQGRDAECAGEDAGRTPAKRPGGDHILRNKENKEKEEGYMAGSGETSAADPPQRDRRQKFIPPCKEEVEAYCREEGYAVDARLFCDYYESVGWYVGSHRMRDWRAAVRNWV